MPLSLEPRPPQPPEDQWAFVDALRNTPYHGPLRWTPRAAGAEEAHFPTGLQLDPQFPDPRNLLDTAQADFARFQAAADFPAPGPQVLALQQDPAAAREAFCLRVGSAGARLSAADTEGIRRGLVWIEDEMQRRGGPFLPLGVVRRRPLIRTRISRCFYGPVNRPPRSRDELADDVDYYPDEYLNRLAHEGVNALWFTVSFFRSVPSRIIPEYGHDAGPRLDKLRRTVAQCARHGIRIYPFCIEPAGFTWPYPELEAARAAHPDLLGHGGAFCTSTDKGKAYIREATQTLFTQVPDLGGLIVIPVGERQTHCYSGSIPRDQPVGNLISCPRCAPRAPWEVLAETLTTFRDGIHSVAPEAELVAWPYGQFVCWGEQRTVEAASHTPSGIILQHNFETGGTSPQLGRQRPTWDYWLSYVGPSQLFESCARAAVPEPPVTAGGDPAEPGVRLSAKLQVSCSHEVATAQVVPAPGLLYRKYRAMRRLGVSSAMLSWYFGSYPSLMTRAAGELSSAPFPRSEAAFLKQLARRDWGGHTDTVVKAWRLFARAYSNYPRAHIFGYFGPMHDGPVWPLYLIPRRLPLAPTWQLGYPPSGDYIAECITNGFTLAETLELCRRMDQTWSQGALLLESLRPLCGHLPERLADIDIACALGLQFRSGYQILRFYALREQLADARQPARRQRLLDEMEQLVRAEIALDANLLPLARRNSCLGFHSEAEGYKYFPDLIQWRMRQLEQLLAAEFPAVAARVERSAPLFPRYTGAAARQRLAIPAASVSCGEDPTELEALPVGPVALCPRVAGEQIPWQIEQGAGGPFQCHGDRSLVPTERRRNTPTSAPPGGHHDISWQLCNHWLQQSYDRERWRRCAYDSQAFHPVSEARQAGRSTSWRAVHDGESLHLLVRCWESPCEAAGADGGPHRPSPNENRPTDPTPPAEASRDEVPADPRLLYAGNQLQVIIEPVRTQPRLIFRVAPDGACRCVHDDGYLPHGPEPWSCRTQVDADGWTSALSIPLAWLRPRASDRRRPLRINVVRSMPPLGAEGPAHCSWARQEPVQGRLVWGTLNPAADFGWLVLGP
jgi:hypothetical protein